MSQINDDFARSVKYVRKQLGLSQEGLAHELGVSFATVNRWENGKTAPSRMAQNQFKSFYEEKLRKGALAPEERE
jgi:putative transcriptional regulator